MSFIIQQLGSIDLQEEYAFKLGNNSKKTQLNNSTHSIQKQRQNSIKSFGQLGCPLISSWIHKNQIIFNVLPRPLFKNVCIIFKIRLNVKTSQLQFSFNLLNNDNKFIILNGKQRRILFSKILVSRYYLTTFQEFKMAVKMETGEIQFFSPIFHVNCTPNQSVGKAACEIFKHFIQNNKLLYPSIAFLKQICNQSSTEFHRQYTRRPQKSNLNKIYSYSHLINTYVNLTLDSSNEQSSIMQRQNKEIQSLKAIKRNYYDVGSLRNGLELFALFQHQTKIKDLVRNYQIDYEERQFIAERTALPSISKARIPENNYILNFIKLNRSFENLQLKKISHGGFTDIFIAQVEYWYVGSYSATVILTENYPPLKKVIIVKRQKNQANYEGRRNRIAHEKAIITKIKHGVSLFLSKYYINSERDDSNEILSDFIPYPTLADYSLENKQTMSYQTKLYFGYIIAQSLRYLTEYKIVHLDLKPSNIMLSKLMIIKLIDFGESFHPQVNNKDFRPGFSVPYSAPENYSSSNFTYKNDVFSLGVILYELFLAKYPFYTYNLDKIDQIYKYDSISSYWFCCPEQNLNFGETEIFPLIQLLVGKCLSNDPKERPELEWIALMLRNCIDYLSLPYQPEKS